MKQIKKVEAAKNKIVNDSEASRYRVDKIIWDVKYDDEAANIIIPPVESIGTYRLLLYYKAETPFEVLRIERQGRVISVIESSTIDTTVFKTQPFYFSNTAPYNSAGEFQFELIRDFVIHLLKDQRLHKLKLKKDTSNKLKQFYLP